jgi:hypothetical protein
MTVPLNVWKPLNGKAYRTIHWECPVKFANDFNNQFSPLKFSPLICSDPLNLTQTEEIYLTGFRRTRYMPIIKNHDQVIAESDKVLRGQDFKLIEEF